MRISRLFIPNVLNVGQKIELETENAHYLRTVLRLKKNQTVILFNGSGAEFLSVITDMSRQRVVAQINQVIDRSVESSLHITLGLGISRGDRMDWAVQKSVELGVNCITPLLTERCVVKFKADKKKQKQQHWRNIVQHATEQSGRTVLADCHEIISFEQWVQQQQGLKVFLDPYAKKSLSELTPKTLQLTLLTGSEGGFSPQEKSKAIASGFIPIRLGQRILRTETASLAALSAAQMLWGDFL